jgi:uncharacterized protein (UPF0262 family)
MDLQEKPRGRLIEVTLDEDTIGRSTSDVEHERAVAIYDLLEGNAFQPVGHDGGPYRLNIAVVEKRLVLTITPSGGDAGITHILSMTPFRKIIKDYFFVCESYYAAIRKSSPSQIEAIDMGRRGLHNEGATVLKERLADKIEIDFDTARRLFTLICALHGRG